MTDADLIKALCEIERGMTEWEVDFVESISKRVDLPRSTQDAPCLTDKQRAVAQRIYDEKG